MKKRGRPFIAPEERFWPKVSIGEPDECWLWLAGSNGDYGLFHPAHDKTVVAHRFAYELAVGPIPEGLTLDHLCRTTLCCNPAHLEPVTMRENLLRGGSPVALMARRTHCARDHELTPENTYSEFRRCLTCRRDRERLRARLNYAKQRAQAISAALSAA